jgi:adenine specific DNA methylase Mod
MPPGQTDKHKSTAQEKGKKKNHTNVDKQGTKQTTGRRSIALFSV